MSNTRARYTLPLAFVAAVLILLGQAGAHQHEPATAPRPSADRPHNVRLLQSPRSESRHMLGRDFRADTLWIFDADFEDVEGDNAGWTSYDRSGTLGQENYWHKDTIRINGFTHLGDSTWWCGKYDPCWRQPRGYGNNWIQILCRAFPEVAEHTAPGDTLTLEYDQRYAMERQYDYGYVDIRRTATPDTWTTVVTVTNPGFHGTPGISQDWDSTVPSGPGHMSVDLGEYAGQTIEIRFRFESDAAYSSQDQYDNPPRHSVLDGAWQLDNLALYDADPAHNDPFWLDDCESPGDNGWVHEDTPATGQTGVTWWRGQFGTDIWTNRPFSCDDPPTGTWMYAAVDPLTSRMVDNEYAWLVSPPIDVSGAPRLVGQWHAWIDLPRQTNDIFNIAFAGMDDENDPCWEWWDDPIGEPGWWYGGPFWGTWTDDWDAFAGNNWFRIGWMLLNDEPPEPGIEHMGGVFLNRHRVGVPTGDPGTRWEYSPWYRFNDWFQEELAEAFLDSAVINVRHNDDIVSVALVAANGASTNSYPCRRLDPFANDWLAPPPLAEMLPGSEIHYYFEALDGVGGTHTFPVGAPDDHYEFSILPINGSVSDPSILLVDKHGRTTSGEQRDYAFYTRYFYEEMLDVLGFTYDIYDVEVPGGSILSEGPDTCGMKYYDTQVWFTGDLSNLIMMPGDVSNLTVWLGQSSEGKERNLLLTGNDVARYLADDDTLGLFASTWLGFEFIQDSVQDTMGSVPSDTLPGLQDYAGGYDFMTHDDAACLLRGGCPEIARFDVLEPRIGVAGAEVVAQYVRDDMSTLPAGVAYTSGTGHQAVTLGFGVEYMSDALLPNGYFASGLPDRADLMANIMEYFGKEPSDTTAVDGPPAGIAYGMSSPRPNPFGPTTTISFTMARRGRVSLRVYSVSGRLVRTLVDGERAVGEHRAVWDGTTDTGDRAASGVYFARMEVTGDDDRFSSNAKLLLLRR